MGKKVLHRGYILIFFAIIIWSFGEVSIKLIQTSVGVYSFSFIRLLIGGSFLLIILTIKKDYSDIGRMFKKNCILLIISCFSLVFSYAFYFIGISNTKANIGAVLVSTTPVWITILAFFILKEKINFNKSIGIILGMAGVIIFLTNFDFSGFISSIYLFGNLLALFSEAFWSVYSVLGKQIQTKESSIKNCNLKYVMIAYFLACIPMVGILMFTPEVTSILNYNLGTWIWVITLGIIFSSLADVLFFIGVKQVDISKAASLVFLKPILATTFAFILLNESITIFSAISSVLIIFSIYLINKNSI